MTGASAGHTLDKKKGGVCVCLFLALKGSLFHKLLHVRHSTLSDVERDYRDDEQHDSR